MVDVQLVIKIKTKMCHFPRAISPKDLKVFLCDHMNYKLEIDELSKIMKVRSQANYKAFKFPKILVKNKS